MIFKKTKLRGAFIIEIKPINDERGFFARSWCQKEFEEYGLESAMVQANMSYSKVRGTLRGLHYQVSPHEEAKLIRCTHGAIYDVIIDLRADSPTYKESIGVELSAKNHKMLYVPEGFAHGYLTLEDDVEASYQVSQFYTPGAEKGIRWDDPEFGIQWPIPIKAISEKDKQHRNFSEQQLAL